MTLQCQSRTTILLCPQNSSHYHPVSLMVVIKRIISLPLFHIHDTFLPSPLCLAGACPLPPFAHFLFSPNYHPFPIGPAKVLPVQPTPVSSTDFSCMAYSSPWRWSSLRLHSAISQKAVCHLHTHCHENLKSHIIILTTARTLNHTHTKEEK
jgi:hypothetical protein